VISQIYTPAPVTAIEAGKSIKDGTRPAEDFADALRAAIQSVEGAHTDAASAVKQFVNGQGGELHSTILAAQKAELSFELFLQVRNKVVQAYQEIIRSQI
jgi:flagellar hook-basal body complex protein FliE